MKPENVNPKKFKVENIIYNNNYFSIAYGTWENDVVRNLAMRWNGESEIDPGYPKLFNNPVWFLITEELKIPIITSLIGLENSNKENIIKVLNSELN